MNNLHDRAQSVRRIGFLDALIAAFSQRETVFLLIAEASDEAEARQRLSRLLGITDEQAGAVLEVRLGQLSVIQREAIASEREDLRITLVSEE